MRKLVVPFLAVVMCALLSTSISAQQKLDETIEVSIVNVDVQVTDRQGGRVTGLRAEDFEIREDGRLQTITNFSEYVPATTTPNVTLEGATDTSVKADAAPATPRTRRSIVIFLEPVTLANFRSKELFDSIRTMLRQTVAPGDRVAIVTWLKVTRVRQEFTDDIDSIMKTLDGLESETTGIEGNAANAVMRRQRELEAFEREFELETGIVTRIVGASDMAATPLEAARRQLYEIKQKTAVLQSLMHSIAAVDGKKIVIMATRRFGQYAGAEYFGGTVPPEHRQELDTAPQRNSLIGTANANNIALYAVQPEGHRWTSMEDASMTRETIMDINRDRDLARASLDDNVLMNETVSLQEMADATGGLSAFGSTMIARLLPRVADDLQSYYSLGYRGQSTGKDDKRSIVVKVKNPAYVVRSRRHYVEKSDQTRMSDRVIARLFQPVDGSTLSFDVALGKFKKIGRNRWSVPLEIRIPISELTALHRENEQSGEFSVYIVTGGVVGVMSDVEHRSQPFAFPAAQLATAKSPYFTYEFTLTVDNAADRVVVGVLDDVGKEFGVKRFSLPKRAVEVSAK